MELSGRLDTPIFRDVYPKIMDQFRLQTDPDFAPGHDERIAAFSSSICQLAEHPVVVDIFQTIVDYKSKALYALRPSQICTHFLAGVQYDFLTNNIRNYPQDFTQPGIWTPALKDLLQDRSRNDTLAINVGVLALTSDKFQRYVGPKAMHGLFPERMESPSRQIDFGASQNHGNKAFAINFPFEDLVILKEDENNEKDCEKTAKINALLARPIVYEVLHGIDLWTNNIFPELPEWCRSNSFRPSELLIPELISKFDRLDKSDPPNVKPVMFCDIADPNFLQLNTELKGTRFNSVTLLTILNQLPDVSICQALNNAEAIIDDTGFIYVSDFFDNKVLEPGATFSLSKSWNQEDYTYAMRVKDMLNPALGFQEVFKFKDGRCRQIKWGRSKLALEALDRLDRFEI